MPLAIRPQAIVVIRFSYVAEKGWQMARQGVENARTQLYQPDRLERRFRLFEALTLPSLFGQTDPDFTTCVLIGPDFPPDFRARLVQLTKGLHDCRIVALPPMHNFKATKQAIQMCTNTDTHIISIRLDDDDAISADCIAEQKRLAPLALEMSGVKRPAVIAFNAGFFLELSEQGNSLRGVVDKLPLGIGLGMVAPKAAVPTIFTTDHRKLHTHWNCYTDAETPRYIRTVHRDNDSGTTFFGRELTYSDTQMDELLARQFPFFTRAGLLALDLGT